MNRDATEKYKLISKKGEGTFSEVVKVQNVENGLYYAMKCMKGFFSSLHQVNSLREIQALRRLTPHPNIIFLEEVLFNQSTGRLSMVFELMDANLYDIIKGRKYGLNESVVRNILFQILHSLAYMHSMGIFHRDIKPENILIDKSFTVVKLADLGSCRSIQNKPPFTEYIATRWYRAPECLITDGFYGQAMDVWGAGCVLFELLALYPLFPGTDEIDQINRIHRVLGSPTDQVFAKLVKTGSRYSHVTLQKQVGTGFTHLLAGTSQDCLDLLTMMLVYDFSERLTSLQALKHPYLREFENQTKGLNSGYQVNVHHDVRAEIDVSRNLLDLSNKTLTAVSNSAHDHTHHLHLKSDNAHQPVNIKPIKGLIQESITHPSPSAKLSNLQRRKSSNVLNNATIARRQSLMNTNHNHVKLPTIENNKRVYSHLNEPKRVDSNQQYRIEKISRPRNKLYANVASSGYGTSYNPTTNSLKEKDKSKPPDSKGQAGKVYLSTLR